MTRCDQSGWSHSQPVVSPARCNRYQCNIIFIFLSAHNFFYSNRLRFRVTVRNGRCDLVFEGFRRQRHVTLGQLETAIYTSKCMIVLIVPYVIHSDNAFAVTRVTCVLFKCKLFRKLFSHQTMLPCGYLSSRTIALCSRFLTPLQ